MKIYREVLIDMNPGSKTYGKHLYEDAYDYNGPLAYAGGKWFTMAVWVGENGKTYSIEVKRVEEGGEDARGNQRYAVIHGHMYEDGKPVETLSRMWWQNDGSRVKNLMKTAGGGVDYFAHVESNFDMPGEGSHAAKEGYAFNLEEFSKSLGADDAVIGTVSNPSKYSTTEDLAKKGDGNVWLEQKISKEEMEPGMLEMKEQGLIPSVTKEGWLEDIGEATAYDQRFSVSISDKIKSGDVKSLTKEEKNIIAIANEMLERNPAGNMQQTLEYIDSVGAVQVINDLKKVEVDVTEAKEKEGKRLYGEEDEITRDEEGNIISAGGEFGKVEELKILAEKSLELKKDTLATSEEQLTKGTSLLAETYGRDRTLDISKLKTGPVSFSGAAYKALEDKTKKASEDITSQYEAGQANIALGEQGVTTAETLVSGYGKQLEDFSTTFETYGGEEYDKTLGQLFTDYSGAGGLGGYITQESGKS